MKFGNFKKIEKSVYIFLTLSAIVISSVNSIQNNKKETTVEPPVGRKVSNFLFI